MQIKFNINADSEAEFHPETLRTLRGMGDVVALDWLKDVIHDSTRLYNELHDVVFRGRGAGSVQ